MATWFIWGVQRVCSEKAIRGLNDILIQANTIKENVVQMRDKKKALEEKIAIQAFESTKAELASLNQKIIEYIDLGKQLVSILDHVATWMSNLMWDRLEGLSRGSEEEWNRIEGGLLHQGPTNTLLEKAHDVASKFYPTSPAPDRESKRTKKNENKKEEEFPVPKEQPGTLGPNDPPGIFGPAAPVVEPKKLSFEQTPMTPGKSGSSMEEPEGGEGRVAAAKKRPGGAKDWTAELLGKSNEEKK
eukprot:12417979-Karenia_brevis.AAC.1